MTDLAHRLTRAVLINAERTTVFRFFTETPLFAAWWGNGSSIDARPGGRVLIRYPNEVIASGVVESVVPDESIVFTYGYEDPSRGITPGGSRVSVHLRDSDAGTRVELLHEFADASQRDRHEAGWRFQLSQFANVAAAEQHKATGELVDRWFAAWNEPRAAQRLAALRDIAEPAVAFRDGFAAIVGVEELHAHLTASQMHMPGITLRRAGEPRPCQGTVLVDWLANRADGRLVARGTNFVRFSPGGRVREVIGFRNS